MNDSPLLALLSGWKAASEVSISSENRLMELAKYLAQSDWFDSLLPVFGRCYPMVSWSAVYCLLDTPRFNTQLILITDRCMEVIWVSSVSTDVE